MADHFDEDLFEARLEALRDTQDGIIQMSKWCMKNRHSYKKVIACWLNVFKRVRIDQRLTLFYLANDVIQYSKRKRYEYVAAWATALQRATTMVRDETIKSKIVRIFDIWKMRDIYSDEFVSDLYGLLNIKQPKKVAVQPCAYDYQSETLIGKIRDCTKLMEATDKSFKKIPKEPNSDSEHIKHQLKDKGRSIECESELERYVTYLSAYDKNIRVENSTRMEVIANIAKASQFYDTQRGEVKLIAGAYKTYFAKVKAVKKKLEELLETLPSPVPSPDINAPSPPPDADIQLPDEHITSSLPFMRGSINGLSSFMNSKLPFDINDFKSDASTPPPQQAIEVIGSRSEKEAYNPTADFYKAPVTLYPNTSDVAIPGLGTLNPSTSDAAYNPGPPDQRPYNNALPPLPLYNSGGSVDDAYNPHMPSYNPDEYSNQPCSSAMAPPPPLPPALAAQADVSGDDFDTSWNMSWLDSSNATSIADYTQLGGEHSALPFGSDPLIGCTQIDYSDENLIGSADIDHRSIQLPPAFDFGSSMPLGKDKVRDFGRRNLINLTGSPAGDKEFSSIGGDIDYRTPTNAPETNSNRNEFLAPPPPPPPPLPQDDSSSAFNTQKKSNMGSSSHVDSNTGTAKYDPADMIIDMDMSDEDNEDFSKVAANNPLNDSLKRLEQAYQSPTEADLAHNSSENVSISTSSELASNLSAHSFGEESLSDYESQNIWDPSAMGPNYGAEGSNLDMDLQQLQGAEHSVWDPMSGEHQWNNNGGNLPMTPPLAHNPAYANPFHQMSQQQHPPRGRGRGWSPYYRPRMPPRGGSANGPAFDGPRPYFHRGGGRGGPRPRFHNNGPWI